MNTHLVDHAYPVRHGEELPLAALAAYLTRHLPGNGPLHVEQFPGGYSNLTYLLRWGDRELVLRRPPFGASIKSAHDMQREHLVLSGLATVGARAPRPLLYCDNREVIGAPFYLMERLHGVILRAPLPPGLVIPAALMEQIAYSTIDNLAALHRLDYRQAGLAELGRPEGYVARQVTGWSQRYAGAQTDELPEIATLIAWLESHQPATGGAALIHNDYKYDNLILNPADLTDILAVLDWEMCTIGDPLMDLGATLGYWIEPSDPPAMRAMFGVTLLPGNPTRSQIIERYTAASGLPVGDPLFYYLFGLFKIAVIIQQIYGRYHAGHTRDARFAGLIEVVRGCGQMALLALDKGRISHLME